VLVHQVHVHHNYMHMHLLQVQLCCRAVTPLDDDELATWRSFLNAHAHVTRRISRDLTEAGLPDLGWYDLLWALHRAPARRLRVNELAREAVLSPTAMSRFVDRAEAAGCVRREPDPADRRALQVVLTDEGITLLRHMWPVYQAGIERYFTEHLGAGAPRMRAMLERVAKAAE
jgi:DNA-binding MarR family transcriptional regulator